MRDTAQDAGADAVLAVMSRAGLPCGRAARRRSPLRWRRRTSSWRRPSSRSPTPPRAGRPPRPAPAIATLPGVTEEMLARVMSADMDGLRRKGHAIADLLTAGQEARITCPNGSDLRLGLEGRTGVPDAGELTAPGAFGNLPCGEGFIAPVEGTAEGRLVIDGTIATVGLGDDPAELVIHGGHLVSAEGERGRRLMELLTAHGPDGTNVAELGIGTNEKAILSGEILEDEKLLGTATSRSGPRRRSAARCRCRFTSIAW